MTKEELSLHAVEYLGTKGFAVSASMQSAFASSQFLNQALLNEMDDSSILSSTKIVMEDTVELFNGRKDKSPTVHKIRDIDVRPAMKKRFCSLPPFCK